jgi:hypothetical protein
VSQAIDVVDTMFTYSATQLDPNGKTYESILLSLIFDIGTDTHASGSGGGTR